MSVSTEIKKSVDDTRQAITEAKPLYAVAGVGDLWVAKLRETTARLQSTRIDSGDVQQRVTTSVRGLQAGATLIQQAVTAQLLTLPNVAAGATTRLVETYDDMAERGAETVGRIRRQRATEDLAAQAKSTVSKTKATRTTASKSAAATSSRAKAARTTARKSAAATTSQAKATRTTARKSAAATTSQAKGAATSARKTATAARKATTAGAKKVG